MKDHYCEGSKVIFARFTRPEAALLMKSQPAFSLQQCGGRQRKSYIEGFEG